MHAKGLRLVGLEDPDAGQTTDRLSGWRPLKMIAAQAQHVLGLCARDHFGLPGIEDQSALVRARRPTFDLPRRILASLTEHGILTAELAIIDLSPQTLTNH